MSPVRATGSRSFSLTEVVVALGISTVAIVSILGLFPLGFDTVRESEAETQAAILARTIAGDLAASARFPGRGFTNAVVVGGADLIAATNWWNVDLSLAQEYWVAYEKKVQSGAGGMIGNPYCLRPMKKIANVSDLAGAIAQADFLAGVAVTPKGDPAVLRQSQVDLTIEFPGTIPRTNRTRLFFSWLVSP